MVLSTKIIIKTMDENYYRELIDRVNQNEKRMWGRSEDSDEGFDDFSKLWDIINDNKAIVSPQIYFEAVDLCMTSFFGTIQDSAPIWNHILKNYRCALENNEDKETFICAFNEFLDKNYQLQIPEMSTFYELMHLAIEDENLNTILGLIAHNPINVECWDQLEDDYKNNPEWAAYYECFSDVNYEHLPDSPIFKDTINTIYSKFGDIPEYDKLRRLHEEYFVNI